jgi:23S rRNA (uracil1939-C5)-methyltransferase
MKLTSLIMEKPLYGGDCLTHTANSQGKPGKAVFVPLTLPGEAVSATITEDKRSFAKADLDAVLIPSPDRVTPNCPHFGICGGCSYQHANYPAQLRLKQQILRETLERASVPIPAETATLSADPWYYRNRIRVALTPGGEIAYRGQRSHDLVPIRECPIAAQILIRTASQIATWLKTKPGPTTISELELFTNADESELLVTLFCEQPTGTEAQSWVEALHEGIPEVTGVRLLLEDGAFDPRILAATGRESLSYSAAGVAYRVDHGAFFQVNRWLVDDFVALATGSFTGQTAWDLFAGVGLFTRALSLEFAQVVAVESAPASRAALQHNLLGTSGYAVAGTTADYLRQNREQREPRPDLIVLDPPRAGLGNEVTTLLNAIGAPQMVYVSCDPTSLARDLRALTQERYQVEHITLVDMFPQTFHLETVVRLRRS